MRPRRAILVRPAMVLLGASLLSACGSWNLNPSVLIKQVPLDLAFGRKLDATPAPEEPNVLQEVLSTGKPEPSKEIRNILKPLPVLPPLVTCPDADPDTTYPERALTPFINSPPKEGAYRTVLEATFKTSRGEQKLPPVKNVPRTIMQVRPETVPRDGFAYTVQDTPRYTETRYLVIPQVADSPEDNVFPPGLYLQQIAFLDPKVPNQRTTVRPQNPLLIMKFPVQVGYTTNQQIRQVGIAYEENPNGTSIPVGPYKKSPRSVGVDQSGQPVAAGPGQAGAGTGGSITSEATVLSKQRTFACGKAADAWRTNWKLTVQGPPGANADIRGFFHFANQYGGWPVRDEVTITSDGLRGADVQSATITTTTMQLEP